MKDISKGKKLVTQDNLNIYYFVEFPKGSKKPFQVMHPGASVNHSSLEPIAGDLENFGYPTLIIEPRGVGYSDKPSKPEFYALSRYSSDLEGIIRTEGLEKPDLIGRCSGFMPIVDYAARMDNTNRLTGITASYCFSESYPMRRMLPFLDSFGRYVAYAGSAVASAKHLYKNEKRSFSDQSRMQQYSRIRMGLQVFDVPFKEIKAQIISGRVILRWDITQQLQELNHSLLIIQGAYDTWIEHGTAEYIKRLVGPNCEVKVLPGNHTLPQKDPKSVSEIMQRWYND